ncbi:MAG: hypothetical protein KC466_17125, partial [Myxococcales bacterium]|nr:hypothetical protein [Myxococcales bacterium]
MNSTRARLSFAILVLLTLGGAVGCASTPRGAPPQDFAARFAGPIERAHGMDRWRAAEAVRTELTVVFGGKQSLAGTLLFETKGARSRIDTVDGATLVFDGAEAWVTPADAAVPRARFHLLTWPYFLAAPMKLRDPGTTLTDRGAMLMGGERLPAATLTFGAGVGDTPDDWYVAYRDPTTG